MFTNLLLKNNPELIDYSTFLHKKGLIQPDTYVLDYDSILLNYQLISNKAESQGIDTFVMTKQWGRHSLLIQKLSEFGAEFVAVDFREAQKIIESKGHLAHVGHLVQLPLSIIPQILKHRPKFITVYSLEQAHHINEFAKSQGFVQNILLRIIKTAYEGQYTQQYSKQELLQLVKKIQCFSHIKLMGLTSFPCFLFDSQQGEVIATDNATELNNMMEFLKQENIELLVKNMPSHNNYGALPLIAGLGATQIEPGHALIGTCPYHQAFPNINEEKIAIAYVSEVSHHVDNTSYIYGGGYYRRSSWESAYSPSLEKIVDVIIPDPTSIDYTIAIKEMLPIGSTVVASFRTQIFVTRSQVALVGKLSSGTPQLMGICDSQGSLIK